MPQESNNNRRLAAILAADVVGYSRLMGADEMGTLGAMKRHREKVFDPAVAANNGRTFKLMGDGTLVEFGSVVDAVRCALEIQTAIAAEPATGGPHIRLRIGINLGDVILDGDDVYGDGVNVAARLEPLADHGGICIASIVKESVGDRVDVSFRDAGEVEVKNISRPIRVWKWKPGDGTGATPKQHGSAPAAEPCGGKSIAVLPFDNMSGDPEQEYFSDGISEDIITDLSRISGLTVIARNSSFAYKGKSVDLRVVGRELGVTSILEGSIRRAGNRVRINAQLIDATNGTHVWAERFDRNLTDIFEVQDEVTLRIVSALKVALTPAEEKRVTAAVTSSPEAHDLVMRARERVGAPITSLDELNETIDLFKRAIELDPAYGDALAGLATAHFMDHLNRWSDDAGSAYERALAFADRAVAASPDEPFPHYARCVILGTTEDRRDEALAEVETALTLNPNFAPAVTARGVFEMSSSNPQVAIAFIEKAMRLDPADAQSLHFLGLAHLLHGNNEMAAAAFRERILKIPETDISRSFLASALGYLGAIDDARTVWSELMEINPRYEFETHVGRLGFLKPPQRAVIRRGLELAGILEPAEEASPA